jgi:iron complex transport system substrate-binding protein
MTLMRGGLNAAWVMAASAASLALFAAVVESSADSVPDRAAASAHYDASRIISVGGAVTEILYALGMQQNIVAVDTTSLYPPDALKQKPNVGYMRQLSPEGLLGLWPTLVLAIEGSGPKEAIDVLQQTKVPFVLVPDKYTGDGIIDKVRAIAHDVGVAGRGECLAGKVRDDLAAFAGIREKIQRPVKVAFVLSLANGRPMLSGRGTAADGIINLAGGANVFNDFEGYKLVNDEAIVAAKPEAIVVMDRGGHALTAETVFSQPALAMTPAAESKSLIAMDGAYLLGFGPRAARAARDLASRLYPNLQGAKLPSEQETGASSCDR